MPRTSQRADENVSPDWSQSFTRQLNRSLSMPILSLIIFFLAVCLIGIVVWPFTPPSTELRGLAVDEHGQPARSNITVFLDDEHMILTVSEGEATVDPICPSEPYNFQLDIPWGLSSLPPRQCRTPPRLPILATGDSWRTTTTNGEHVITIQNLGDPEHGEPIAAPTGDISMTDQAPIYTQPLVRWAVFVVVVLLLVSTILLVMSRSNWRAATDQVARWRRSSLGHRSESAKLREKLVTYFSEGELQDLCQDMGIDYEGLRGPGKGDKARELVAYCERHSRIRELVAWCTELRPRVDW